MFHELECMLKNPYLKLLKKVIKTVRKKEEIIIDKLKKSNALYNQL